MSLFSEIIANDKPILILYNGKIYLPILIDYSELDFGGNIEINVDYRDHEVIKLIKRGNNSQIIWPPIRFSYNTINHDLIGYAPSPPSLENLLGTDDQGRDILSRIIYGFRISILFGLCLAFSSSFIGIIIGGLQGYFGGWIDLLIQRIVEIWSGLPSFLLIITLSSLFKPGFFGLLGIMLLFHWTTLVNIIRLEFLRVRELTFIKAAKSLGVSNIMIIIRHMLPNVLGSILSYLPFIINNSISILTSSDFLGFGLPTGYPSLGDILIQGRNNIHCLWIGLSGIFSITLLLILLMFIGESIRDVFNPKKSGIFN